MGALAIIHKMASEISYIAYLPLTVLSWILALYVLYRSVSILGELPRSRASCVLPTMFILLNISLLFVAVDSLLVHPGFSVPGPAAGCVLIYAFLAHTINRVSNNSRGCCLSAVFFGCWILLVLSLLGYLIFAFGTFSLHEIRIFASMPNDIRLMTVVYLTVAYYVMLASECEKARGWLVAREKLFSAFCIYELCTVFDYLLPDAFSKMPEEMQTLVNTYVRILLEMIVPSVLLFALLVAETKGRVHDEERHDELVGNANLDVQP